MMVMVTVMMMGGLGQVVRANEFNFSVTPILPENQIGKSGYFNLKMAPGQSQELTLTLTNSTERTVVVEETIASATTNINGVIEYSPNDIKHDKTLKYNITDYAKIPAEITLAPNSSQQVKVAQAEIAEKEAQSREELDRLKGRIDHYSTQINAAAQTIDTLLGTISSL